MSEINFEDEEYQTKRRYHITAKITKKRFSYEDLQSRGKRSHQTAESIVLIPEQTTECDSFYRAWLPPKLTPEELKNDELRKTAYHEIVMQTGNPINGYFRGALCHADLRVDRPHIFVMTKSAEDLLSKYEGKKIRLVVLGEGEEENVYELKPETRSPIEGMQ